ncbi:hypothetical protein A2Z67_05140 [Candidatus Woesebacteria bacterium RBG_13_36_22]|uniref:Uncharacterized protein n=1 Tax=Candidatus Woesebacteria bacterium RBG_13_36_22 TaxID=1802478 RepID=A0A1F7X2T5_9BACT|nr:MAG: hypothetical protein A2Z67_05140 [Candidatus Woesebacteria bacterium RBG_13_36_22]
MRADARSMKRSRQERLLIAETQNKQNIDQLVVILNDLMDKMGTIQREFIALRSLLIDRRIISELELEQVKLQIKQYDEMRAKGLILGEKEV